jgi:flagellar hook-basal body complex protein FliE
MNLLSAMPSGFSSMLKPAQDAMPKAPTAFELSSLKGVDGMAGSATLGGIPASTSGGFSDVLGQMVQEVNGKQAAAGDAVQGLLSGDKVSLHQAMISMEEASVSFQLMVEVRNKLLESYQEIMRMQI